MNRSLSASAANVSYDSGGYLSKITGVTVGSPSDSYFGLYDVNFESNTPWSTDFVWLSNSRWGDAAQNDLFAALDNAGSVGPHGFGNTELVAVPSSSSVSFSYPLQHNNANSANLGWTNVTQSSPEIAWTVFCESTIPESSTAILLLLGLMGLASARRR